MVRQDKRLMALKKDMKKKRPSFRRVESWRHIRVKDPWRKARGIDSQTRMKTKSGVRSPSKGYRSPKKVRGIHPSGYEDIRVETLKDFENLNKKTQAVKIASNVGSRKRMVLIDHAQRNGFKVLNVGMSQKEMDKLEAMLNTSIEDY